MSAGDPYSGHVCLPGGAREKADATLLDCALREAHEELGIDPRDVEVIAELGWHETLSLRHRVKPFAGIVRPGATPWPLRAQPEEVERVLYLPAARLREDLFQPRVVPAHGSGTSRKTWSFDLDGHEVWGLTARILRAFVIESQTFRAALGL